MPGLPGPPEPAGSAQSAADSPERPRRAPRGELLSATAALVLLVLLFLFEWYGVDGIPGRSEISTSENGWHGLTMVRWLVLLTIIVTLGSLVIHATQRTHGVQTETSGVITVLGTLTALVLTWRVLIVLPSPNAVVDQKLGGYLAVLSAYAIALGGYDAMRSAPRRGGLRQPQRGASQSVARGPEAR